MPTFWVVNDRIKAKLIELATLQMSHAIVNMTKYSTRIAKTSRRRRKVLILKPKAPSFHTAEFLRSTFPHRKKTGQARALN